MPIRYSEWEVEKLKAAVREIAATSDTEQEVSDRMKSELGYPYTSEISFLGKSRVIVKFIGTKDERLEV